MNPRQKYVTTYKLRQSLYLFDFSTQKYCLIHGKTRYNFSSFVFALEPHMNGTSCLLMPCSFIIDDKVMVFIQCKTRYSYVRRKAGINLLCFERELNNYTKITDMIMTTRKQEYKNMLELSKRKNGCNVY